MKKIISTLFLALIVILPLQVKALSVSKNDLTIEKSNNDTIELYAEVDTEVTEVSFSLVYTSYDIPANFNIESGLSDKVSGINHKIVFTVPVTGKIKLGTIKINVVDNPTVTSGSVNIHSGQAITTEGEIINLDRQIVNVTIEKTQNTTEENEINPEEDNPLVTENDKENEKKENNKTNEETEDNNMLLEKIESSIVKINLKNDVYEYSVKIKEEVEELDLKPIVKDDKYKVEITTQKISELKDNQIIITVKNGEVTEEYKIKVNIAKNVEIDETEFESTYKYKGRWTTLIIIFSVALFAGLILVKKK